MIKFFAWLGCLCLSSNLLAQEGIRTKNELNVEDLVKNVFIKGSCRNVSNITAIGSEAISIGQFENGENNINISDGIILSTGDINLAQGPNFEIDASYSFNTISNDPDLSQLATSTLFDVTGIEFDFVPLDNRVSFRYVFASEEYCEFVGTSFNDVFGFFVSGPGINGTFENNAINIASTVALDGTDLSVSINNINHLTNENFYINNITTTDAQNCGIPFVQSFQDLVEYDGFTIVLTAAFQVIPCETYHIRLVIGDVGDSFLDSAVFLQSSSFDLGEPISVRAEVPGRDEPIAYEDCVDGQFVFTRNESGSINEDFIINYSISSDSEATNGVDFVEIPLTVTIPAGETEFILPITIIEDNIVEGPENIKLVLEYACDCIDPTLTELIIDEAIELSVNNQEVIACAGQTITITPEIIDGIAPYNFLWNTGATTENLEVNITTPTQYNVTVTDFCGTSSVNTVNIDIQETPSATLTGTYDLCETITTGIPIQLAGNPPWEIGFSINDMEQPLIDNIQTNPYFLNTSIEGTYLLTTFNDVNCNGIASGSAIVEYTNFLVETNTKVPSCFNSIDGSIEISQLEAIEPFTIQWNIDTENEYLLENLPEGTYTLNIIDGDGCIFERVFELPANSNNIKDCAPIYFPNVFSPNNDGFNDIFSPIFDSTAGIENIISMQIYNRWGSLMFEQTNFNPNNGTTGWDGDFKGKPLNPGVYLYKIEIAFEDQSTLLLTGDITLIR